jgi:predicted nucleic acid-binding protein
MFLLDTNVISELRKNKPHGAVLAWFESVRASDITIPASVIAELQEGVEMTRRQDPQKALEIERWIDRIMLTYVVVSIDGEIIREWVRLMVGKSPNLSEDVMIAATARLHRSTVVTRNITDFADLGVKVFNPFAIAPGELV